MVTLEGLEVVHKVFGNGIVEKVSNKYVTVRFANLQKVFVYPDAFEVFLSAIDEAVSRDIAADLAAAKEKRKAHDEEIEKARRPTTRPCPRIRAKKHDRCPAAGTRPTPLGRRSSLFILYHRGTKKSIPRLDFSGVMW